ncbi:type IV pilin protein [Isoalcanivorax beigongshangi]|uniref:Type IV pilin protein n=1 Tax=Isoalcanivorax beigongshangi TaxID=3238810 RepID=A0ABV4AM44_9GAMM
MIREPNAAQGGFTLLELLMVVVIIGILAAVAYPSYQGHIQRTHQAEVKSQMLGLQSTLERYRAQRLTYQNATVAALATDLARNRMYNVSLEISANFQGYTLTARPQGIMVGTGAYAVNHLGQRCHNRSNDSACTNFAANWD